MGKRDISEFDEFADLYAKIAVPMILFSTFVGFGISVLGEVSESLSFRSKRTPIKAFINITGCTSLGVMTGVFWPVAMPLLGMGAIVNMM